jgi:hypothetical protein
MAVGWEEYSFRNLRFEFVTKTGSTTPGSLIMAPDYDAADAAPSTEAIACSYAGSVGDAPWTKSFSCSMKRKNMNPALGRRYIRTAALAANLDIKTYDEGNLFVCTVDGTAVPWGNIWVEYDVDFFIPQLPPTPVAPPPSPVIQGGTAVGNGNESAAIVLGDSATFDAQSVGLSVDAGGIITIADTGVNQDYIVSFDLDGTTMVLPMIITNSAGFAQSANYEEVSAAGDHVSGYYVASVITGTGPFTTQLAITSAVAVNSSTVSVSIGPYGSL